MSDEPTKPTKPRERSIWPLLVVCAFLLVIQWVKQRTIAVANKTIDLQGKALAEMKAQNGDLVAALNKGTRSLNESSDALQACVSRLKPKKRTKRADPSVAPPFRFAPESPVAKTPVKTVMVTD